MGVQYPRLDRTRAGRYLGLGQELKNAIDLLDFNRVLALLVVIVALTMTADRVSAALRLAIA
jgi:phosphonate transport system permease protein